MKEIQVAAALIRKDNRTLIAKRKAGEPNGSLWELPGGKIEAGETAEECLRRELNEEFEIDASVGKLFVETRYQHPDFLLNLKVYHVDSYSGELKLNAHEEIQWAERLDAYEFCPADIAVIERLTGE